MQSRYFKRLLPLIAVALLILAFLAIELTPGPCERTEEQKEERRKELFTQPNEYLKLCRDHGTRQSDTPKVRRYVLAPAQRLCNLHRLPRG